MGLNPIALVDLTGKAPGKPPIPGTVRQFLRKALQVYVIVRRLISTDPENPVPFGADIKAETAEDAGRERNRDTDLDEEITARGNLQNVAGGGSPEPEGPPLGPTEPEPIPEPPDKIFVEARHIQDLRNIEARASQVPLETPPPSQPPPASPPTSEPAPSSEEPLAPRLGAFAGVVNAAMVAHVLAGRGSLQEKTEVLVGGYAVSKGVAAATAALELEYLAGEIGVIITFCGDQGNACEEQARIAAIEARESLEEGIARQAWPIFLAHPQDGWEQAREKVIDDMYRAYQERLIPGCGSRSAVPAGSGSPPPAAGQRVLSRRWRTE